MNTSVRLGSFFLSLAGSFAAFSAAAQENAPPPAEKPASVAATPAPSAAPASSAAGVGTEYVIGPGDTLQVFVWRHPELTTSIPVRPDGKISTPLVEDMIAVGKRPSALSRDIEGVLAEYVRSPQVNVIVTNAIGVLGQVQVIGQVTNPQSLPFRQGMRVLDAVLASGGLAQYAAGNRAKIVRTEGSSQRQIKVRLGDLVNKGSMKHNIELRPGDVIVVPQSIF